MLTSNSNFKIPFSMILDFDGVQFQKNDGHLLISFYMSEEHFNKFRYYAKDLDVEHSKLYDNETIIVNLNIKLNNITQCSMLVNSINETLDSEKYKTLYTDQGIIELLK